MSCLPGITYVLARISCLERDGVDRSTSHLVVHEEDVATVAIFRPWAPWQGRSGNVTRLVRGERVRLSCRTPGELLLYLLCDLD